MSDDFTYQEFYMRENDLSHLPLEAEMKFYDSIKSGNMAEVEKAFKPLGGKGFGKLSEDGLRNLRYHLIITIAFAARYCIEGGMEREEAYNLSDLYIMAADKAKTTNEINRLHKKVVRDLTERMAGIIKKQAYSRPISRCLEYVYNHLNQQISISEMAKEIGFSAPYLSKIFHRETGITISGYIMKKRIETAQRMLKYSDYTSSEISCFLAFSSNSHFIQCFRRETGLTPKQYRALNFNKIDGIRGGAENY